LGLGDADPSFRSPMSIAVIGGLITSTILSLLVVPAVFTYVDDTEHLIKRMWAKLRGKNRQAPAATAVSEVPIP
jgi:predicted RND superfamily exporter protein